MKKFLTLITLMSICIPAIHAVENEQQLKDPIMQSKYLNLKDLIQNANDTEFKKQLDLLVTSPEAKKAEFKKLLTKLSENVQDSLYNTYQDLRSKKRMNDILLPRLKWGIAELALAGIMVKFSPRKTENSKLYYSMMTTGIGLSALGLGTIAQGIYKYEMSRALEPLTEALAIFCSIMTLHAPPQNNLESPETIKLKAIKNEIKNIQESKKQINKSPEETMNNTLNPVKPPKAEVKSVRASKKIGAHSMAKKSKTEKDPKAKHAPNKVKGNGAVKSNAQNNVNGKNNSNHVSRKQKKTHLFDFSLLSILLNR